MKTQRLHQGSCPLDSGLVVIRRQARAKRETGKITRVFFCLLALSLLSCFASNATADSNIIGTAIGSGTIPGGQYEGQAFTVTIKGEYSGYGIESLVIGEAKVVIGTEVFTSVVSDFSKSFCCGNGRIWDSEFDLYGQVLHETSAGPHYHLFAASATTEGFMCFNIADQTNTTVDPVDPPCDPGIGLICDIPAVVQIGPAVLTVQIDIKPGSCPNPLNTKSKGVLSVAILGTEDFDVTGIDHATIQLSRDEIHEGISPIRWSYEDVAAPFDGDFSDCHALGPDELEDLTLKFDTQEIVSALGLVDDGEKIVLTLTGNLFDGTPIEGQDYVRILKKGK